VTNQSNCNCFIYLLQILSLRFVFHLHYHVHQILVYHNVLVTQPIDPRAWSINCPSMCAHCNCQGSHYCVGPKVGVHNIVDRTYHYKPIEPTPPSMCTFTTCQQSSMLSPLVCPKFSPCHQRVGPKRRVLILAQILYVLRRVQSFKLFLFFSCDVPIKLANCPNKRKKKTKNLRSTPI
jgi:hypothetical protein